MRIHFLPRVPGNGLVLFAAILATLPALHAQDANTEAAAPPPSHQPPVSAKINSLAHRVLQTGLKGNALGDENLPPWHIKIDYQMRWGSSSKPVSGSLEEWHSGPYQWRRVYTGSEPALTGSEWSISRTGKEYLPPKHVSVNPGTMYFLALRVARPVVDPMYQAANVKPEYDMQVIRTTTGGVTLNCTSVADPSRYADEPDYVFATTCFDADMHLRLTVGGDTSVQFDDIQIFQNRAVARDVKVIQKGALLSEMKVTLLEPLTDSAEAAVKPPPDAEPEPYIIEPGFPSPESIYEVAASIPFATTGVPFHGTARVPVIIHKDGTVKVQRAELRLATTNLGDALESAVNKWKYKPYLVDGEPVEVAYTVPYTIDGKPFVASYDKPKPKPAVTAPNDFSSTYDPKRDALKDLAMAESQASAGHKHILVDVGGDWCVWCRILDKFFDEHPDLRELRDSNYVLLKVNMSAMNENQAFLSQYPAIPGYPWLFVLDQNGKLLVSKNTNDLENGAAGYSPKNIKDFLAAWRPK